MTDLEGQAARSQAIQVPSNLVSKEFGKVYVRRTDDRCEVDFTVWIQELEGSMAEGWQTGVALDASASMKNWYGRALVGKIPDDVTKEYVKKGLIVNRNQDGRTVSVALPEAYKDAMKRGFLKLSDNIVQPWARKFVSYLASELDADGGTTVIYWACGDGGAFEVLGDFTSDECESLELNGPQTEKFGNGTRLAPAMKYFVDRFDDAERGMYIFLTDGKIDDLDEVKQYSIQLAQEIAAEKRSFVKLVLIGVGDEIDEAQMKELDDLDSGVDVDLWDHKIAVELRALSEIIVELVGENRIVAPTATVFDSDGNEVKRFSDGLPARGSFSMGAASEYFELEVGGQRIKQTVVF
ncbi:VWA domain-containing protein [Blastopirellula sp. JC732]|uniref:VWA domain-containing protein n=1 Tax=Blastopirellula sediminis TaxID=2894196 RepID=A0A9X1SGE9_9BACT|nr:vWA domain-containing protein [Blastopirellula sediminis]MCC9608607.1 VWA domain-containing protein [Blastopirellula sediminis]MCC9628616.1 VWA domain-containing protein [Blastopirellula sediminis]